MALTTAPIVRPRLGRSFRLGRRELVGYTFLLPLIAFFLLFHIWPIVRAFWLSFTNYKYLARNDVSFVGLDNYLEALEDSRVLHGIWLGVLYVLMYVPASMLLALFVAVLLDRVAHRGASNFYRTVYYLPVVMPGAVVYVLWKWMYYPSFGLVNTIVVDTLHLPIRPQWLSDYTLALPSIVLMELWRFLGYNVLLLLVGLASINRELYEAARIDGASERQVIWHVTLPLLKPTFLVMMVLKMSNFAILEPMLVTPGIGDSTQTWAWRAYQVAFQEGRLRMGYASAIGHLCALIMSVFVVLQYRLFRHERA
jgi:ABC-type sugar transport system permease subunit